MGDQKDLDNLTRHAFQEYCVLEAGYAVKCYDKMVNGKKQRRHMRIPIKEWKNGATLHYYNITKCVFFCIFRLFRKE